MKKVKIIRVVTMLILVLISLTMCACTNNTEGIQSIVDEVANERDGVVYDDYLIEIGRECLAGFDRVSGRVYTVNFRNNTYFINLNGEKTEVDYIEDLGGERESVKTYGTVKETKFLSVINRAKAILCDYIEKSTILNNKEELKQKIVDVPFVYGKTDDFVSAFYTNQTVYINKNCIQYFSEWVVVHELVHYLCELTHGGPLEEDYPFTQYVETMTDLITMSMQPEENLEFPSGYFENYEYVLPFVGRFEEEALQAYFYGHKRIWQRAEKYKFDVYVGMLENLHYGDLYTSWVTIENQINEWACQVYG